LPQPAASAAAMLPMPLARRIGRTPGRLGTMVGGMRASIGDDQHRQRQLEALTDRIVVLNETARRMLMANGCPAAKLVVNRLGVSQFMGSPRTRPAASPPVRFGFVGRLHPLKGIYELADAVRRIDSSVEFVLEIRGPAETATDRTTLAELRRRVGGDRRVRFANAIAPEAVVRELAALDVLCCPSTTFENGPTVAIEAMAAGTPIIGSRVGNLAEIVTDGVNGRLVPPGDVPALAAAIAQAAADPSAIDRWRAALSPVRTMDDVAADYEAMYADLVPAAAAIARHAGKSRERSRMVL
jgi:glycosyltransferase involved in cell wall biosynthesis